MNTENLILIIPPVLMLLLIVRILMLSIKAGRKSERRKNAWINLYAAVLYSAFCWLPVLTYEEQSSDLPSIDIGPALLVLFWFCLLFLHVLVFWIILEAAEYRLQKRIREGERLKNFYDYF